MMHWLLFMVMAVCFSIVVVGDMVDVDGFRKPCDFACHHGACFYEGCKDWTECPGGGCTFVNCKNPTCSGGACVFDNCVGATCGGGRYIQTSISLPLPLPLSVPFFFTLVLINACIQCSK